MYYIYLHPVTSKFPLAQVDGYAMIHENHQCHQLQWQDIYLKTSRERSRSVLSNNSLASCINYSSVFLSLTRKIKRKLPTYTTILSWQLSK